MIERLPSFLLNDSVIAMRPTYSISQAEVSLSATRPICASHLNVEHEVAAHDHDYYEICLVLAGRGEHQTEFYRKALRRGSVLVVPPGGVHALTEVTGLRVINLYYLAEWLLFDLRTLWDQTGVVPLFLSAPLFGGPERPTIPQFQLNESELRTCLQEVTDLEKEVKGEKPSILFLKSTLFKLFIRLSRIFSARHGGNAPKRFRPEVWKALESIEECVVENRRPSAAALAATVRLSEDHLGRVFREATGRTMNDYYQRRRVHLACSLLLNRKAAVADVVYTLGYSDAAHFCRMFKRYTGNSPKVWQRQYLEK